MNNLAYHTLSNTIRVQVDLNQLGDADALYLLRALMLRFHPDEKARIDAYVEQCAKAMKGKLVA